MPIWTTLPFDEHPGAVGQRGRVVEVMRDHDRRESGLTQVRSELPAHPRPGLGIEGRKGLVEEQHGRSTGKSTRQGDALALSSRQVSWSLLGKTGDPETFEEVADPVFRAEGDVRLDGEVWEERVVLEDEAGRTVLRRDVDTPGGVEPPRLAHADRPPLGANQAGDRAQQGRLPRPRRPRQGEGLRADLES